MGERGRELYGLEMSPHNSQLVACGGEVVVVDVRNAAATGHVAAMDDVVVVAMIVVWV